MGDGFARNSPAWIETIKSLHPDFPVYGSVCEANEYMQRIIGPESLFMWLGLYPEQIGHFIERANAFALEILKAQIKAADGLLDGIVIWGDIAYKKISSSRRSSGASGTNRGSRRWSTRRMRTACR